MGRGLIIFLLLLTGCHDAKVGTGEVTIYKDADLLQQEIASAKPNDVIIIRHNYETEPGSYVHITKPLKIVFHPGMKIRGGIFIHDFSDGTEIYDGTIIGRKRDEYLLVITQQTLFTNTFTFEGATELEGIEE